MGFRVIEMLITFVWKFSFINYQVLGILNRWERVRKKMTQGSIMKKDWVISLGPEVINKTSW
jgi:hypothetical protein